MKSLKEANWGCGGVLCLITATVIPMIYLATGGLPVRGGRIVRSEHAGLFAFLISGFFFLLGVFALAASFLLRLWRNSERKNISRWRKRR